MRAIKILYIITRLNVGGAQDIALSMASGLDKNKFEVTFISGPQDFSSAMADKWNVNVTVIPPLIRRINPIKDLLALARLYFFIKKNRFDIVHTHTSKAGILGRIAARLAGVPVIFHSSHGSIFHPVYYGPKGIFFLSRIENFAASFTDKIITISENEKEDFLRHKIGVKDKYITIYNGIKADVFLKAYDSVLKRKELGIPEDATPIGIISRLVPEKGHAFCLEAFQLIVKIFPKTILFVAGDGLLRQAVEAKIEELNLKDNVIMLGHRNDVAEILGCLDILLHPSIWEGMPIAIIEAMFLAKAIVATNVGGIPELIEDGKSGILVPALDKEALVNAVTRLINDRAFARKIGETARQSAKEKFSRELMLKNITGLYNSFVVSKKISGDDI